MSRCELQQSMIVYAIVENWDLLLMILWENIIWEASTRAPYYSSYLTSHTRTSCIPIHRCTIVIWNGIKVYPPFMSMIKTKILEFDIIPDSLQKVRWERLEYSSNYNFCIHQVGSFSNSNFKSFQKNWRQWNTHNTTAVMILLILTISKSSRENISCHIVI